MCWWCDVATQHLFAKGHNNVGGLKALHSIAPPLFDRYQIDIRTQWKPYVERVRSAAGIDIALGLPTVIFIFPVMSDAELRLLRTTFFDSLQQTAPVTVQTYDYDMLAWLTFNGQMHYPDMNELTHDRGQWTDVMLEISDLQLVSAFDEGFDALAFGGW